MKRDLAAILRGGYCHRWHMNPDLAGSENLAEHHGRVAQILLALHPAPTLALIDRALHHDAGEPGAGDLSSPFKRRNPTVAKVHALAEAAELHAVAPDLPVLDEIDGLWLKLADILAALCHAVHRRPDLFGQQVWRDDVETALNIAADLGDRANARVLPSVWLFLAQHPAIAALWFEIVSGDLDS